MERIVSEPEYERMIHGFKGNFNSALNIYGKRLIDLARSDGEYQTHVANLVTKIGLQWVAYGQYLDLSQINDSNVSRPKFQFNFICFDIWWVSQN